MIDRRSLITTGLVFLAAPAIMRVAKPMLIKSWEGEVPDYDVQWRLKNSTQWESGKIMRMSNGRFYASIHIPYGVTVDIDQIVVTRLSSSRA